MSKNNCGSAVEIYSRVLSLLDIVIHCVKRTQHNVVLYPWELCCRLSLVQELKPMHIWHMLQNKIWAYVIHSCHLVFFRSRAMLKIERRNQVKLRLHQFSIMLKKESSNWRKFRSKQNLLQIRDLSIEN